MDRIKQLLADLEYEKYTHEINGDGIRGEVELLILITKEIIEQKK